MTIVGNTIRVEVLLGSILLITGLIAWALLRWRSKMPFASKTAFALVILSLFVAALWIGWKFQPWMPVGRAIQLSSNHIGDYDLQVWQRRNAGLGEPFATGLFIRKHESTKWHAYLLDFEDVYRPTVTLLKEDSSIVVTCNGRRWGRFDEGSGMLQRDIDGEILPVEGLEINTDPPGNWWLRQSSMP